MLFLYKIVSISFLIQSVNSHNEETSCGCSTSRSESHRKNNIYSDCSPDLDNEGQCSVNTQKDCPVKDNLKPSGYNNIVLIPGGKYQLGTDDIIIENDNEGPKRIGELKSFYIDKYEVSNRDFNSFVQSQSYKTEAESFGDSFVFSLFLNSTYKEKLKDFRVVQALWWYKVDGANWLHPHGPDTDLSGLMDHPVIHVSWRDAQAYCKWRGARLPTEAEWEAACRGGLVNTKYPWGDRLFPDKTYMANLWQGTFPNHNSAKDGYIGTNPVTMFPPNGFGLYNMAGNVWEWTEDSWAKDTPKEKVKKGGSYLCHRSYCYRYRCSARSHNTEDSSAGNLGFRCAKNL